MAVIWIVCGLVHHTREISRAVEAHDTTEASLAADDLGFEGARMIVRWDQSVGYIQAEGRGVVARGDVASLIQGMFVQGSAGEAWTYDPLDLEAIDALVSGQRLEVMGPWSTGPIEVALFLGVPRIALVKGGAA